MEKTKRYAIEPQHDLNALHGNDPEEGTHFVKCDDYEAIIWAVFDVSGDDPELIEDFPSREAAQAFIDQQEG